MINIEKASEHAIANSGNLERIKRIMRKAQSGGTIVLGFLGGSITQGSLASTPETCYAYLVYLWWKTRFPKADFKYVNAGIGATTSQFGAARVGQDLLQEAPDFVIVEFSVNDENNEFFEETYEGLIRKLYGYEKEIGILIVNNVRYDNAVNAQEIHNKVGRYYEIPCVSIKDSLYSYVEEGEIERKDITPDDLHPNDYGHKLVSNIINCVLERIYQERNTIESIPYMLDPFTKNQYEHSYIYQNDNCTPLLEGFEKDASEKEDMRDIFKKGWIGKNIGDKLLFHIEGTGIAIQFRKTIQKPAPIAKVFIDDDENGILLDGNFEETWGDCLYLETILIHGENKKHKVQIEIVENHMEDKLPFYLVSIIGSH